MGGGAPDFPAPTAEEKALQQEQTDILRQQKEILSQMFQQQNLLAPFVFEDLGLKPTLDEEGNITGFEEIADPNEAIRKDIETKFLERTQAALKGELPQDPGLLRELSEQERNLREGLARNLGPDFETSTPGIEALANFQKRRAEILSAASRGELSLSESLGLARSGTEAGLRSQNISQLFGAAGRNAPGVGAGLGVAGGFGDIVSQLSADRARRFQAEMAGYQGQQNTFNSIFSGLGSIGGMALGLSNFGGLFSP